VIGIVITAVWLVNFIISGVLEKFRALEEKVALAFLTVATTVIVATLTVVFGRYYERKKDIEAHFREQKIKIYDGFLKVLFEVFKSGEDKSDEVVSFLWEWHRQMILWGGQNVLRRYIDWLRKLRSGELDAKTMWITEDLFRAIRKDIGHSSWKLTRGTFVHLILKHPDLFINLSRENPNITLSEIGKIEKEIDQ
jgi:hypothetical protein